MKQIINNLLNSFSTNKDGFAARKLTAFAFVLFIAYTHYFTLTTENVEVFLWVDLCGCLVCLGLVTASNLIELKNGSKIKEDGDNNKEG